MTEGLSFVQQTSIVDPWKDMEESSAIANDDAEADDEEPAKPKPRGFASSKPAPAPAKSTPAAPSEDAGIALADNVISGMFANKGQGHGPGTKGKTKGSKNKNKGQGSGKLNSKEINKSETIGTEAAQFLQAFDDASAIYTISEKKVEELLQKIKGRLHLWALCSFRV